MEEKYNRHRPSPAGDDDLTAVFEESQKRFRFPQQEAAQYSQGASTSRGVNVTLLNPSDEPMIASRIPNERKRLCDRAYRERLRMERKKMESDLQTVGNENEDLKRENQQLRLEKDLMDQVLQARAAENQRLKTEVCGLKGSISHQQVLVDAFSRKLLHSNHEASQLLMLRQEIERLRGNITWTEPMEEKKRLLDTKINLENQNKALNVQVQALCEKIYNDKNHQE